MHRRRALRAVEARVVGPNETLQAHTYGEARCCAGWVLGAERCAEVGFRWI